MARLGKGLGAGELAPFLDEALDSASDQDQQEIARGRACDVWQDHPEVAEGRGEGKERGSESQADRVVGAIQGRDGR